MNDDNRTRARREISDALDAIARNLPKEEMIPAGITVSRNIQGDIRVRVSYMTWISSKE